MTENEKQTEVVDIRDIIPDDHNFNAGTEKGREMIEKSFRELGAGRSILLDKNNRIIAGNKSQQAAIATGITKVRIVDTDGDEIVAVRRRDVDLDSKVGRELAFADNATQQVSLAWDETELQAVQADVEGFDIADFGFDIEDLPQVTFPTGDETEEQAIERKRKEFEEKMAAGELDENDPEYQEFVKKFQAKRTTDDCYTPDVVYDAVAEWVASEYNVSRANFVRPFYPGGDYQKERYKPTDIVVDNPPFSILASIIDWYNERGIRYFLFGPQLTLMGTAAGRCTCLAVGVQITYANGAEVNTSFVTNMDDKDIVARADARLYKNVDAANLSQFEGEKKRMPRYTWPKEVIMSPFLHRCAQYGIDFVLKKDEVHLIEELEMQREFGKQIFGKGYLVSNAVLNRRLQAEAIIEQKEDAYVWKLSDSEREIIEGLNKKEL